MSKLLFQSIINQKNAAFSGMTLLQRMDFYHIPVVSLAVVNNGSIDYALTICNPHMSKFKKITDKHLFQAASISKPVFAVSVMRLYEEGLIDIDEDINHYLKNMSVVQRDNTPVSVTLRQILAHCGGFNVHGFPGYSINSPIPSINQILKGEGLSPKVVVELTPGTMCRYSGGGITFAQKSVCDQIGIDFNDLLNKTVFKPLSMHNSTFSQPLDKDKLPLCVNGYLEDYVPVEGGYRVFPELAAAGLWSTPSDIALLGIEMQKALDGQSAFLSKQSAETMVTPQRINNCHYGIGFGADDVYFGHTGSHDGYASLMRFSKKGHNGMVVMLNSVEGTEFRFEVFNAIANLYKW